MCHFHLLFNGMLQHGYIPTEFLKGTITPIVKDSQGDISDPSNYRGITLSCLPAKLFEFAIQLKTSHLLDTDNLQFGFKKRTSTNHALYALKETIIISIRMVLTCTSLFWTAQKRLIEYPTLVYSKNSLIAKFLL